MIRRQFIQRLLGVPFVGGVLGGMGLNGQEEARAPVADAVQAEYRDYFQELGLRTFINAHGTITALSGSLVPPEVRDAWVYATNHYVELDALQDKAGECIAELIGCEYATVTAGAFSAMTLGTAGVLCGMDEERVQQLPDTSGMKNEVIVLKQENPIGYVHALKNTGARLVEVANRRELDDAINEKTAMLFVFNAYNGTDISKNELVSLGKKHGIPTFNDCAADVPPVENLWKYTDMGFDLVAFSGGKGIRGPQSAGLLLGREDLVRAARLHAPPRGATIGRGMKVNKEEVLAMMVAVERYVSMDHREKWREWESQIEHIGDLVDRLDGVETEQHVPEIANHVPTLRITWDRELIPMSPSELENELERGHPSIAVGGDPDGINVSTWMMRPGEVDIVGRRIHAVLEAASA